MVGVAAGCAAAAENSISRQNCRGSRPAGGGHHLPGRFALGCCFRVAQVNTVAVGIEFVDAAGVLQVIVIVARDPAPGLFVVFLLCLGPAVAGLLFLALVVLGVEQLMFLREALGFGGVCLLDADVRLPGAG